MDGCSHSRASMLVRTVISSDCRFSRYSLQFCRKLQSTSHQLAHAPYKQILTGQTEARPQRCHVVPKLSGLHPAIEAQVSARPDATIAELRAWRLETHQVSASTGLINKTLAALDLTFKKKSLHAAEQAREDVARARVEWREQQPTLTPAKLVSLMKAR